MAQVWLKIQDPIFSQGNSRNSQRWNRLASTLTQKDWGSRSSVPQ
jgi:hypothetical protein